jgi:hypothetical protein
MSRIFGQVKEFGDVADLLDWRSSPRVIVTRSVACPFCT